MDLSDVSPEVLDVLRTPMIHHERGTVCLPSEGWERVISRKSPARCRLASVDEGYSSPSQSRPMSSENPSYHSPRTLPDGYTPEMKSLLSTRHSREYLPSTVE